METLCRLRLRFVAEENARDVIELTDENGQHRQVVAYLSEGYDTEVEQKMQRWMTTFHSISASVE